MSLRRCIDNLKFDARMVDINLKSQLLTADELKKHRESLPDLKAQTVAIDLENSNHNNGNDRFSDSELN